MGECRNKQEQRADESTVEFLQLVEKSRREFLTILDSVPGMIWYRDGSGKILRTNKAAADSVGVEVRELVGKNYYDLFPEDAARSRQQDNEVIATGRPLQGLLREVKTSGRSIRWLMEDRFPMQDNGGRVVGVMAFVRDVTKEKLTEERLTLSRQEVERSNEQLRQAANSASQRAEEALRSNQTKSEMLANSSHDLRTPMNAIVGFAELLADSDLNAEQREYVQTIHKAASGLLSLINDILDFAKLDAGKLSIQMTDCQLSDFVEDIRVLLEPGVSQKGLAFDVQIDRCLPETFLTDPLRLRQCLVNLLGNAMKFTTDGTITLSIRAQHREGRPHIRFDVEDTGIGIPKDKQSRIFQPYSQAESAIERMYGGTGLGLTITKKLTELLGGEISVASEPGKGSVFSIILPLEFSVSSDLSAEESLIAANTVSR